MAGGPGNDRYVFDADADLGSDVILEPAGLAGGVDTLDFSLTTGLPIDIDLALTARQVVATDPGPPENIHLALEIRNANTVETVVGAP